MSSWHSVQPARIPAVLLAVILASIVMVESMAMAGPGSVSTGKPVETDQGWPIVVDWAGILDEGQERSAIEDSYRLNVYDIPTQVVTEAVALNQIQADARADELRSSHGIESSRGAQDGLLIYASVDPSSPSNIVIAFSIGDSTLPQNGLTTETLGDIRDRIVTDQLAQGHPARAIVYSLREMIYFEQYVPPAAPVSTGWKARVNRTVDVVIPVVSLAAISWLVRGWYRSGSRHATPTGILIGLGLLALTLVVLAVQARSSPAAFAAASLGAIAVWRLVVLDRSRTRTIVTTPRPPGTRAPAGMSKVAR